MAQENINKNDEELNNGKNNGKRPVWVRILKWMGIVGGAAVTVYGSYKMGYNKGKAAGTTQQ